MKNISSGCRVRVGLSAELYHLIDVDTISRQETYSSVLRHIIYEWYEQYSGSDDYELNIRYEMYKPSRDPTLNRIKYEVKSSVPEYIKKELNKTAKRLRVYTSGLITSILLDHYSQI